MRKSLANLKPQRISYLYGAFMVVTYGKPLKEKQADIG